MSKGGLASLIGVLNGFVPVWGPQGGAALTAIPVYIISASPDRSARRDVQGSSRAQRDPRDAGTGREIPAGCCLKDANSSALPFLVQCGGFSERRPGLVRLRHRIWCQRQTFTESGRGTDEPCATRAAWPRDGRSGCGDTDLGQAEKHPSTDYRERC